MSDESTIESEGRAAAVAVGPRLGLVVPGAWGPRTAGGLPGRLLATAARTGVALDVVDLEGGPAWARDRDGYVLLVGQYGPVPTPAAEDLVTRSAARWAGRPIGLVAYGGVSRGRDAATRVRRMLTDLGAIVVDTALGVNVAQLRGDGPSAFERVGAEMVLEDLVTTCVRSAATS